MNTQDWSPLGWTGWISLQFQIIYYLSDYLLFLNNTKEAKGCLIGVGDELQTETTYFRFILPQTDGYSSDPHLSAVNEYV